MKKTIFLGLSLLAIAGMWTGCSNEDGFEQVDSATVKQAISFRTQGGMPETKTTATTTENIEAFVVYGTDDAAASNIFDGVTIARQTDGTFSYSPKRYYTEGAATAVFAAYSPVSANVSNQNATDLDTEISFDYVVAPPVTTGNTAQEDLLVSGNSVAATTGTVSLQFGHALSRIFVKATNDLPETVVIKELTLKNLNSTGTITGTPAAAPPDVWTWAWDAGSVPDDYRYVLAEAGVAVPTATSTATLVTSMEQGMMVLPQKTVNATPNDVTAGDFALEVIYDVANLTDQTAHVYLTNDYEFEMNKQYAITIAFTAAASNLIVIDFTIGVDPFGAPIVDANP